jgi:hypothetical protein
VNLACPLLPVLVFVALPAAALDSWGVPDLGEQDKRQHAAAGFVIGGVGAGVAATLAPRSTWWTRALIGVAAAAVIGAAKEAADARGSDHCSDPKDALATVAGGTVGALSISLVWRF